MHAVKRTKLRHGIVSGYLIGRLWFTGEKTFAVLWTFYYCTSTANPNGRFVLVKHNAQKCISLNYQNIFEIYFFYLPEVPRMR